MCTTLCVHHPKSISLISYYKKSIPLVGLIGGGENLYKIQYLVEYLIIQSLFFQEHIAFIIKPNPPPSLEVHPHTAGLQKSVSTAVHTDHTLFQARWRLQWLKFSFNNI